jgi:hypothetical protein
MPQDTLNQIETFTSDSEFVQSLQAKYGSIDAGRVQTRRRQYYSFVSYPLAGSVRLQFFSTGVGQSNRQLTNIQQAGVLDNPFLIKAIRCKWFIQDTEMEEAAVADSSSLYSDFVQGLFTSGVMMLKIGSKDWLNIPSPFLYAPPAYGMPKVLSSVAGGATGATGVIPYADLQSDREAAFIMSPSVLINQDQNFQLTIEYPTGLIPVIATGVVTVGNPLYVGVEFDGIEVRPVQ